MEEELFAETRVKADPLAGFEVASAYRQRTGLR